MNNCNQYQNDIFERCFSVSQDIYKSINDKSEYFMQGCVARYTLEFSSEGEDATKFWNKMNSKSINAYVLANIKKLKEEPSELKIKISNYITKCENERTKKADTNTTNSLDKISKENTAKKLPNWRDIHDYGCAYKINNEMALSMTNKKPNDLTKKASVLYCDCIATKISKIICKNDQDLCNRTEDKSKIKIQVTKLNDTYKAISFDSKWDESCLKNSIENAKKQ